MPYYGAVPGTLAPEPMWAKRSNETPPSHIYNTPETQLFPNNNLTPDTTSRNQSNAPTCAHP